MSTAKLSVVGLAAAATPLTETQVVIAGGGPVGLAAAIELGRRGIDCVVVEPRVEVSQARPRCKTINVRTMEHLRRWGLAELLRERAPLKPEWSSDIVFCTSLVGYELSRFTGAFGLTPQEDRFPELGQQAPQYLLEELLRQAVEELPSCRLLTGARLVEMAQGTDSVAVTIADNLGASAVVRCDYVLGCDGARSTVRAAIGSAYAGEVALRPNFGMVFDAPALWEHVAHGPAVQYWVVNEKAPALIGPIDLKGRWWIIVLGVEREFGEAHTHELVRAAVGANVQAEIVSTDPWTARMQIVDSLGVGRVFLAGDAAHLNPPFGGHGLNTGIGDAVDLGWKLAAVLQGWAAPGLLETYSQERRPVQEEVIGAAVANMGTLASDLVVEALAEPGPTGRSARSEADRKIQQSKDAEFHSLDLVLAAPRLPHAWLDAGRSLYDALGDDGLTLLLAGPCEADRDSGATDDRAEVIAQVCGRRHVPFDVVDVRGRGWDERFGGELVLVRPDQLVAWRGDRLPRDPERIIDRFRGAL